ncbi:hypothetical protein PCE1_000675 [Barthelona sp. PCE]
MDNTCLLICDIQTAFKGKGRNYDAVVESTIRLVKLAKLLEFSVHITEQVPDKLGRTDEDILAALEAEEVEFTVDAKKQFAMTYPDTYDNYIIVGLETHVCVLQTIDLIVAENKQVFCIFEGISSITKVDRDVAFNYFARYPANVRVMSLQSFAFYSIKTAEHPHFRAVSKMFRHPVTTETEW